MLTISPSLLSCNFLCLKEEIEKLNQLSSIWLHLDIMDGHFVPQLTFGEPIIKKIASLAKHPLDLHFMVNNPEDYLLRLKSLPIHNFTFHWEVLHHHDRFIKKAKETFPSVGISLNPSTPLESIPLYLLEKIDLLLLMSVNPGFGGQSFISPILEKIKKAKKIKDDHGFSFTIQVDGGVHDKNISLIKEAGAQNFVAGSFFFSHKDYQKSLDKLL